VVVAVGVVVAMLWTRAGPWVVSVGGWPFWDTGALQRRRRLGLVLRRWNPFGQRVLDVLELSGNNCGGDGEGRENRGGRLGTGYSDVKWSSIDTIVAEDGRIGVGL
jgi:hypothetical protein